MKLKNTFHDEKDFERETYEKRMIDFGFKNMARMELFLWDLELFLQIQRILGDRIVLKGGAATQFYLPREIQRTSVDIDMIFYGSKQEIEETLNQIEVMLGADHGLFHFKEHIPKNPKTSLSLYTYYVKVPSVLSAKELNNEEVEDASQEVKIEFIMASEKWKFDKKDGQNIFAVNSKWEYQILPISFLFADKMTTLGPNTIGVQDDRMDEQVKQFYDIMMITKYCLQDLEDTVVQEIYFKRAKTEWEDRRVSETYDVNAIIADVRMQLKRFAAADSGEDALLKKHIADFNGLYLNSKVEFTYQSVACGASLVHLMYELMLSQQGWEKVKLALDIEESLELKNIVGKERGLMTRKIRERLVTEFESYSVIPVNILKSKNLKRVFWAVADIDNLEEIRCVIEEIKQTI